MKADLYIRVSTEEQKLTGFSQRYQEEILKAYCSLQTITVEQVIFEEYSAKTFNRPAWKELFTAYRTHRLPIPRLLLVTKWDRFSRNTSEAYEMLGKLSRLGVEVRAIEQPVDMSIPENKMMLAFFLAVPEVENQRRSLEIRKGRNRGITEGRWMGLAPYAYKNMVAANGIKFIEPIEMQDGSCALHSKNCQQVFIQLQKFFIRPSNMVSTKAKIVFGRPYETQSIVEKYRRTEMAKIQW